MSDTAPSPRPHPVSAARIEANRRNARKSTGPRTPEGKAASRMNSVTHGFRCEVVEPESHRPLIDARAEAWIEDFGPTDAMQAWYVRRAAAVSVRLDLCVEAEADARLDGARRAAGRFETAERAKVRRLAGQIEHDPVGVVETLESSGYGIDWLVAELRGMVNDLEDSDGYLGAVERRRALAMLKINPKGPGVNHEHPVAGPFMRAALGNDPDHPPEEADRWTGLDLRGIPEHARRAEHAKHLPSMEEGRLYCLAVIQARLEELEAARDAVYDEVDAPRLAEARRRGGAIGGTRKAQTLRRYESALSLDMTRAMSNLLRLRRESDRRPHRDDERSDLGPWAEGLDPLAEPASPAAILAPECQLIVTAAPAPNEPNSVPDDFPKSEKVQEFREPTTPPPGAHQPAPDASGPTPTPASAVAADASAPNNDIPVRPCRETTSLDGPSPPGPTPDGPVEPSREGP
jgi:hypothetical protein